MRKGRYERRPPTVFNLAICMAIVLFWLVLITTHVSVDLFARYVTEGTGNDGARVLTFGQLTVAENDVEGALGQEFIFIPGVPIAKDITVSFGGSEADVFVFAEVEAIGWTRGGTHSYTLGTNIMSWAVDTKWTYLQSDGNTHVYYIPLDANRTLQDQHVIANNGTITVNTSTRATYEDLQGEVIQINVTAHVVQAGGFYNSENMNTNAAAAWASLNH